MDSKHYLEKEKEISIGNNNKKEGIIRYNNVERQSIDDNDENESLSDDDDGLNTITRDKVFKYDDDDQSTQNGEEQIDDH